MKGVLTHADFHADPNIARRICTSMLQTKRILYFTLLVIHTKQHHKILLKILDSIFMVNITSEKKYPTLSSKGIRLSFLHKCNMLKDITTLGMDPTKKPCNINDLSIHFHKNILSVTISSHNAYRQIFFTEFIGIKNNLNVVDLPKGNMWLTESFLWSKRFFLTMEMHFAHNLINRFCYSQARIAHAFLHKH
ncbi:hypothetical protein ACJX0J_008109 [Zea mays]